MKKKIGFILAIMAFVFVLAFNFQAIFLNVDTSSDISLAGLLQNAQAEGESGTGGSSGDLYNFRMHSLACDEPLFSHTCKCIQLWHMTCDVHKQHECFQQHIPW
jgi:hypothetical protein